MKRKTKKLAKAATHTDSTNEVRMFVMYGFKKNNIDTTAYLQIRKDGSKGKHGIYKIVHEEDDATRFPDKNINNIEGFAPPQKWAKFFNEEEDLSGWCFHPIAVAK